MYPIVLTLALAVGLVVAPAQSQSQQRQQHGKLFPPENLPELEGPDRDVWQRPDQIMDALNIAEGSVVAELGAGSGWFTIRLAERVGPNGKVYAEDIQPQMIEVIKRRVRRENFSDRIETMLGSEEDPFVQPVLPLDAVLINDAYHEMEQSRGDAPQCREGAQARGPSSASSSSQRPEEVRARRWTSAWIRNG